MKKSNLLFKVYIVSICLLFAGLSSCNNDDDSNTNFDDIEDDNSGNDDNDGNNDDGGNNDNASGGEGEITLYSVENESITKIKDYAVTGTDLQLQQDTDKHNAIWEMVKKVIPASNMNKINEFLIYSGAATETLGFVVQTTADLSKWQFGIAIDLAYESGSLNGDGELLHTIIHEFGHILTLNNDQVNASINETNCTNYFVGEGCANSDAYINLLQTQHWDDIWDEFNSIASETAQQAFYTKYKDRYVSDYAATNPGEDIAEVFATFVIREGGVNGTSKAEQKIQLMYDASELTELRTFIRNSDLFSTSASAKIIFPTNRTRKFGCLTSKK